MARLTARCLLRGGIKSLGLKPTEGLVLVALLEYDGREGIQPSQQTIEDGTGIKRESVGRIIQRLAKLGILRVVEPARQHKAAKIELLVRCDATSHLHSSPDATLTLVRCDATSHLNIDPGVTQRKHLDPVPDVTLRHTSNKYVTEQGLPGLARSGPARPSVSRALRAADDDEENEGSDSLRASAAEPATSRAGNEAAELQPPLEPRQTTGPRPTDQPQYAREPAANWPTRVPGTGEWSAA